MEGGKGRRKKDGWRRRGGEKRTEERQDGKIYKKFGGRGKGERVSEIGIGAGKRGGRGRRPGGISLGEAGGKRKDKRGRVNQKGQEEGWGGGKGEGMRGMKNGVE